MKVAKIKTSRKWEEKNHFRQSYKRFNESITYICHIFFLFSVFKFKIFMRKEHNILPGTVSTALAGTIII